MTLSVLALALLLLCPYVLGAALLRRLGLGARGDVLGHTAWSLMGGGLTTGALLYVACWARNGLDARVLVATQLVLAALLAWRAPTPAPFVPADRARAGRLEEWLFAAVVALLCWTVVAAVLRASTRALVVGDEARIFALKAKLLFDCGGFDASYGLRTGAYLDSHADYPLLNPLLQLATFLHAGALVAVENRFPVQVFVLALLLATASALRAVLRPAAAAAVLLVAQSLPMVFELTRAAGADQMVALGMLVALDGLLRAQRSGDPRGYRLTALGLAFAVFSKNEGTAYALALLAAAGLAGLGRRPAFRRPAPRTFLWLALPAAVLAASLAVRARFGFENDVVNGRTAGLLLGQLAERARTLVELLGGALFTRPEDHADLFGLFLVLLVLAPLRLLRPRVRLPTLLLALLVVGWFLIYVGTPHDLVWHVTSSARRLVYSAFPCAVLWLALVLAQDPLLGRHLRARRAYLSTEADACDGRAPSAPISGVSGA